MDDREEFLRNNIASIAETAFPDSMGNEWIIHSIMEHEKGLAVEVEPSPNKVGYSRFRLIFQFKQPDRADIIECYVPDESGNWVLLFTH